jgi:hypothetical protein
LLHNLSKESASGASLYTSVKYSSVSYWGRRGRFVNRDNVSQKERVLL